MKPILLIGACGSGKTWVMHQLIANRTDVAVPKRLGLYHFLETDREIIPGKYTGKDSFDGGDRLSMAVMRELDFFLGYVQTTNKILIAEGDRFTNSTFISKAAPIVVKISDDGRAGRLRRASAQSERHIKSIATRVANIRHDYLVADSAEALVLIKKLLLLGKA